MPKAASSPGGGSKNTPSAAENTTASAAPKKKSVTVAGKVRLTRTRSVITVQPDLLFVVSENNIGAMITKSGTGIWDLVVLDRQVDSDDECDSDDDASEFATVAPSSSKK